MAFLERVLGRTPPAAPGTADGPEPLSRDDRIRGRTDIAAFLSAFDASDPDALRRALATAPTWGERGACLDALHTSEPLPWLNGWVAGADPADPLPFLVRGSTVLTSVAAVSDGVVPTHRLRQAELDLLMAARADPTSPLPWVRLIVSGALLGIPKPEIVFRLDEAMRRDPANLAAHRAHVEAMSADRAGSDQEAWAFAMTVDEHVPVGSPLRAIVADAAVRRFGHGRETATISTETTIVTAAKRSVLHPDFATHPCVVDRVDALAGFAEIFAVLDMPTELERVIAVADRMRHHGRLRGISVDRPTDAQWARLRSRLD